MKNLLKITLCTLFCTLCLSFSYGQNRSYYQIKVYHITKSQEAGLDNLLKNACLPALHKRGIKNVGVFKPIVQDTADVKVYVCIPFSALDEVEKLNQTMALEAEWDNLNYKRVESILLHAFIGMPQPAVPTLTAPKTDRVYELRSYESGSEKLAAAKIRQFNSGEISIFTKLNFNAVFYAEVISGARMPNLMYLTTHNSMADRDANWVKFTGDADWKVLSKMPEYQHLVSKSEFILTHPTDYSDY